MKEQRIVPLTKTQMGIYVESVNSPESTLYNLPHLTKLDNDVDLSRLKEAIEKMLVARPCINTILFLNEKGEVMQKLAEEGCRVEMITMTDEDFAKRKESLVRPFHLLGGLLARLELYITPSGNYFFEDFHHIIMDGTSQGIVAEDINKAYWGQVMETEPYNAFDVALEEEARLNTEEYEKAKAFYRELLGDIEDTESLPMRDVFQEEKKQGWFSEKFELDPGLLNKKCSELNISKTTFFTGVMGFLMGKYTFREESVIATLYNGRGTKEKKNVVSMLVKTLPFVADFKGNPTIHSYLKQSAQNLYESRNHDLYSFGEIVAEYGVTSDVSFAYQGRMLSYDLLGRDTMRMERIYDEKHVLNSPLILELFEPEDDKFLIRIGYRADMFSENFAGNMARAYVKASREFLEKEYVSDVEIVDEKAWEQIETFNATESAYDRRLTVVEQFRNQVKKNPEKEALVYLNQRYTYRQLDEITDLLAKNLVKKGIGKETVVGVLIPRCEYMVICALGVLKAGGAYLPLDSTYPAERLNLMVEDSGAKIILTTEELSPIIGEGFSGEKMMISEIPVLTDWDITLPQINPEDLFVMLYTSGTTGLPKGVMLEHGNLIAFCHMARRRFRLSEQSKGAAYASYGFDANLLDTYPMLTAGGTLHIISEEMRMDLLQLQEYFNENGITLGCITTQVGRQFAMLGGTTTLESLVVGGEKLVPFNPPKFDFYNGYGPTETVVFVTAFPVKKKYKDIPIGGAVDNIKLYVVDKKGKLLPPGGVGELWVSGPQVGRGYLNRLEQTEAAFGKNPFCEKKGYERIYRTGDVVRHREDGTLQFVGRKDAQVKIRGFRIELTEIEEVIRRFEGVQDATVVAFDDPVGGKYVAAYLVAEKEISVEELEQFILREKPPYMVPAVTMQIDKIPLNQNHKVNKKALPVPTRKTEDVIPPTTEAQKKIFDCVAEALGHRDFGVTTDIFAAGITSISAIRLNVLLADAFQVVIKASDLKNNHTVLKLEQFLLGAEGYRSYDKRESYPLTAMQEGVLVDCMANENTTIYNIPYLVQLPENVNLDKLKKAVEEVVEAHPYLKTQLTPENGDIRQRRMENEPFEVVVCDALDQEKLVRPFPLMEAPLFRFELYKTEDGNYFFADIHHLIADGTSFAILFTEIKNAYDGKEISRERYTAYDLALDCESEEGRTREAKKFYDGIFENCGGTTGFCPDLGKEKPMAGKIVVQSKGVTTEQVEKICKEYGITENVFFTAAFGVLLARYHFSEKSVFTTIYNGRNDSRRTNTVGMLVNTLPVLCRVTEDGEAYFKDVQEQLLSMMSYEGYPFSKISADYQIKPDVMMAYQGDNFRFEQLFGEGAKEIPLELKAVKAPVTFVITKERNGFTFEVEYRADMYTEESVECILENFERTVDALLRNVAPAQIRLTFDEAEEMVDVPGYSDLVFAERFALMAEKYPDNIAIKDKHGSITYRELDKITDFIACRLNEGGFSTDEFACVLCDRSGEFVMAILGIMKAGGAYVPLDAEYPRERIEYMISDSGSKKILAVSSMLPLLNGYQGEVLLLDDIRREGTEFEKDRALPKARPKDLAYMIYTSGTTGKPKGVEIEQGSLMNLMAHMQDSYQITPKDMIATYASFCFDASVVTTFLPLCCGATLFVFPEESRKDVVEVAKVFHDEAITMSLIPTQIGELLADLIKEDSALRILVIGGEKFKQFHHTKFKMFNAYGPTENTVACTEFFVDKEYSSIPIGRSFLNLRSYVLDEDLKRVPVGVPGELCVAGRQVARGYHNLPEKTEEVFCDNPYSLCDEDKRMYRTGDLVRIKGDGNIEYVGRIDTQLKISGFRIEPAEIEGAMMTAEGVKEVLVMGVTMNDTMMLSAYYTGAEYEEEWWNTYLEPLIPEYMIPSFFTHLEAMPITAGGKVDKKALPVPQKKRKEAFVPAKTPEEKKLADVFSRVLGMENISMDDNFFTIGGSSLTASKVAVIALAENIPLVYADIFKYPTIGELAAAISSKEEFGEEKNEISGYHYDKINQLIQGNVVEKIGRVETEKMGSVLLTGATGFLGIHILKELMEHYDNKVYCMIRKGKYNNPKDRLKNMLMYYFDHTYEALFDQRIFCIDGDITDHDVVEKLTEIPFDTLINCAACVKHFSAGDLLEKVNVKGVENLIRLCQRTKRRLIQISTVSVAGEAMGVKTGEEEKITESKLYFAQKLDNEYIRTKFLAERAVLEACAQGLDGKVVRVGNLMSRNSDGEFQINFITNGFLRSLRGYKAVGAFPVSRSGEMVEFSPIDATAEAVLRLAETEQRLNVFHACNNLRVSYGDVMKAMIECGFPIDFVSQEEFESRMNEFASKSEDSHFLSGLIAYLSRGEQATYLVDYNNDFTTELLKKLNFTWPDTDKKYLKNAINAMKTLGFFDEELWKA